jgi:hypothetical protein
MYRILALLDVDAALPESEYDFWKEKLASCTECPLDILQGGKPSDPDSVEAYLRKDGVTRFCCDIEMSLCAGYSDAEYAVRLMQSRQDQWRDDTLLIMFEREPWSFDRPSYLRGKLMKRVTSSAKELPGQRRKQTRLLSRGSPSR